MIIIEGNFIDIKNFYFAGKKLVEGVQNVMDRVATNVTNSPGEQERLLKNPIDILCFGRAGVGKTTLLEALTGRNLGSTPRLDHGTQKLECCDINESLPRKDGSTIPIHIRFWDSKGIEKWTGSDVEQFLKELSTNNVKPLCVLYCATSNGRVDSVVVTSLLQFFFEKKIAIFYVVTNIYSQSDEQLDGQIDGGIKIMSSVSGYEPRSLTDLGKCI
jgi:GTPase SAR1 family protein